MKIKNQYQKMVRKTGIEEQIVMVRERDTKEIQ